MEQKDITIIDLELFLVLLLYCMQLFHLSLLIMLTCWLISCVLYITRKVNYNRVQSVA